MAYRKPLPDRRNDILIWAALAIVLTGLFSPWVYTFHRSGTGDHIGWQSERSAGYALIFKPPVPSLSAEPFFDEITPQSRRSSHDQDFCASIGIKLDIPRLLVEWACILAVSGAAWGLVRLNQNRVQ